jgi:two-component system, NtrC family, nitrogen regulation sensor histidine kinase GlnL
VSLNRSTSPLGPGLDLLASAVLIVSANGTLEFANLAAEQILGVTLRQHAGLSLGELFRANDELAQLVEDGLKQGYGERTQDVILERPGREAVHCQALATVLELPAYPNSRLLIDFRLTDQRLRLDRESRLNDSARANRELVRNLAHEIKNPLGGIRGAAQLLEVELSTRDQREYTQVIIKEADRLQSLVDRLLAPHRKARLATDVNVHEVCERVRSIVLAEYPAGLTIVRDYDASLPEFHGDKEQMIQTVLNLVHNAAQALLGQGKITLRTRIGRKVVLQQQACRLALELHVVDNGPGIPEDIREHIFFPLVSGREGGSGLGLSLAQTFVHQHGGTITCESRPGLTDFKILLPLKI